MGIYRPFIRESLKIAPDGIEPSDKIFTPANAVSVARLGIAAKVAQKLVVGERYVTPWVCGMGASDAVDGFLARLIDRVAPESGLGASKFGADVDEYVDAAAMIIVGGAALVAPRMPIPGRLAVAAILGNEGTKVAWALQKNEEYRQVAEGRRLRIPASLANKEAMAEKITGMVVAVLASDFDDPRTRNALGAVAFGFAAAGSVRSQVHRQEYEELANQMIADAASAEL